mmetsp:Transcript_37721/g.89594  ORF Transcript_37721/g.89594 Transcript_37721/m.89594 type:complete len:196 (-) Transcript_37721:60-647(-)
MPPKLEILSAIYTSILDLSASGEKGKDVTTEVRGLLDPSSQTVRFAAGVKFNDLFGDPEPFHPKVLKILYTVGGVDYPPLKFFETANGKDRIVPEVGAKPVSAAKQEDQLEILKATWGTSQKTIDVTAQFKDLVSSNRAIIPKDLKLTDVFGDPAIGRPKQLEVTYKLGGEEQPKVVIPQKRSQDTVIGGAFPVT